MKSNIAAFIVVGAISVWLESCAADAEEFATTHNPEFEITYLLTEFEDIGNRSAESIWRASQNPGDPNMGYHYMFDDGMTEEDWVVPHAGSSTMCKDENGDDLFPKPDACGVTTGFMPLSMQDRPFTLFGSKKSFHWYGTAVLSGVGFGTY
ncbi:MAG: hypothetical protein JXX14_23955, partial [Deltaproteobacteria bacterium]|nr:hypothetical protein [Deltaproteobacteria bacterium]